MMIRRIIWEELEKLMEDVHHFEGYRFVEEVYAAHHNQVDYKLAMYDGDQHVAQATYTEYQDKIYINLIESFVEGKGYGFTLMKFLADKYGYENIERSTLTAAGAKLRDKLDKHFGFDYEKYRQEKSDHISKDIIRHINNHLIKDLLNDFIHNGLDYTSEKWTKPEKMNLLDQKNIDFNDVLDLSAWIKNSKTNNNPINIDPPDYVIDYKESIIN